MYARVPVRVCVAVRHTSRSGSSHVTDNLPSGWTESRDRQPALGPHRFCALAGLSILSRSAERLGASPWLCLPSLGRCEVTRDPLEPTSNT